MTLRVGLATVVAQKKHESPIDACLNDAAVRSAVHIDPCFAPGIFVAKLRGCCSSKGVTKYPHAGHAKSSREPAGLVRGVQPFQPIKHKHDVGSPRSQQSVHAMNLLLACHGKTEFRVVLRQPSHYPAVRENNDVCAIRCVEAHNDVTVAGQILRECRVIPNFARSPCPHDDHRIGLLLR